MKLIRKWLGNLGMGYYIRGAGVDKFCTEYSEALEWAACGLVGETVIITRWMGGDTVFVGSKVCSR